MAWAHTLRGGELLLGAGLSFGLGGYPSPSLEAAFGLASGFQAGLSVARASLAQHAVAFWSLGVKGRVPLAPHLHAGFPLGLSFQTFDGIAFHGLTGGVVLSFAQGDLTAHGKLGIGVTRYGLFLLLSTGLDFDFGPALRLGAQAQVSLPGLVPSLSMTVWLRPLPFLDLRLDANPLALSLGATAHLRLLIF